jgi:catechol 2,3-dioxygenase
VTDPGRAPGISGYLRFQTGVDTTRTERPMSSTAGAPAHVLPDTTHVASVRVGVRDLERSLAWYDRWFGLVAHALDEHGVLGLAPVGGRVVLELVERPAVEPFGGRHTGLFHFALRVPERVDLARWLAFAAQQQLALAGAADHFVSEAIYLTDPDGHGIEIYWDRPRATWEGQVHLMTTASLDINDLFGELETLAISSGSARVPPGTTMGHVHLQVADIDSTVTFLRDVVGFELMASLGRQAVFLATGGYHHDIGANVWSSRGAPPAPDTMAHLERVTFAVPDQTALDALRARAGSAGLVCGDNPQEIVLSDPSANRLIFTIDAISE